MKLAGREMRKPFLILHPGEVFSGEPDARKPASPVRERGVGNVLTARVRERGLSVSITLASPSGDVVTRQLPISYLIIEVGEAALLGLAKWSAMPVWDGSPKIAAVLTARWLG